MSARQEAEHWLQSAAQADNAGTEGARAAVGIGWAVLDLAKAVRELAPPTVEVVPGDEVETAARVREALLRARTVGPTVLPDELRVAPLGFTPEEMASLHRMVAEWDVDNAVDGAAPDYSGVADHVGDQTDEQDADVYANACQVGDPDPNPPNGWRGIRCRERPPGNSAVEPLPCYRELDHEGQHVAADGRRVLAVWPNEDVR